MKLWLNLQVSFIHNLTGCSDRHYEKRWFPLLSLYHRHKSNMPAWHYNVRRRVEVRIQIQCQFDKLKHWQKRGRENISLRQEEIKLMLMKSPTWHEAIKLEAEVFWFIFLPFSGIRESISRENKNKNPINTAFNTVFIQKYCHKRLLVGLPLQHRCIDNHVNQAAAW